jgi:hypothetical protein
MRDRLRQTNALSHALAVGRDFSIPGFDETDAFERNLAQLVCSLAIETVDQQKRIDKLASGHTSRKRIKLRAVADFAKQLSG